MQAEADTDADRTGEYGERAEMDPGVIKHDENADDQDNVSDNLRDGVLQRAIESAVGEEAIEKETFGARGKPEHHHQQPDEQEKLNQTEVNRGQRRAPSQRDAG